MGYKEEKQRQLDRRYLRMARIWAENSYCVRRKVGALIVKDKMIISDGYNGTPSGFEKHLRGRNRQDQILRAPRRSQRHHEGGQKRQQLRRLDALHHRRTPASSVRNSSFRPASGAWSTATNTVPEEGLDLLRKVGIECVQIDDIGA